VTGVSLYEALDVVRVRIERIGGVVAGTVVVVVGCFTERAFPFEELREQVMETGGRWPRQYSRLHRELYGHPVLMSVLRTLTGLFKSRAKTPEEARAKAEALDDQRDFRLTKVRSRDAVSDPKVSDSDR